MYVYDMDGKLLWSKDLGDKKMRNQFGEGSTPVLAGDRLVIVWDQITPGASFVVALDASTPGGSCWRVARDEIDTWATPLVVEHDGRAQAVVPGDEQDPQLRPGERQHRLGEQGRDDEPDSVAGRSATAWCS